MAFTLGAGGDLERLTGRSKILRLPIPDGWEVQGIGRRFFVFPEKSLNEEDGLALRHSLMREAGRSLVLTPRFDSAAVIREEHIRGVGDQRILAALSAPQRTAAGTTGSRSTKADTESATSVVVREGGASGIDDSREVLGTSIDLSLVRRLLHTVAVNNDIRGTRRLRRRGPRLNVRPPDGDADPLVGDTSAAAIANGSLSVV